MKISKENLPLSEITQTTLKGQNGAAPLVGWSIGGFWLNGSADFKTKEALFAHLEGKELTHSASKKSLVIVGEFVPIVRNESLIKSLLVAREAYVPLKSVNLADLL